MERQSIVHELSQIRIRLAIQTFNDSRLVLYRLKHCRPKCPEQQRGFPEYSLDYRNHQCSTYLFKTDLLYLAQPEELHFLRKENSITTDLLRICPSTLCNIGVFLLVTCDLPDPSRKYSKRQIRTCVSLQERDLIIHQRISCIQNLPFSALVPPFSIRCPILS